MSEIYEQQLNAAKKKIEETKVATQNSRQNLLEQIKKLSNYTTTYEDSWEGDWAENPFTYAKNFKPSSGGWMTIDLQFIKRDISKHTEINIDELRKEIPKISKQFFELREFLITELSFIRDTDTFSNEIELLKQIEDFKWGMMPGDYVRSRRPRYAFVYDPSILIMEFLRRLTLNWEMK
jgi:hypothetical protein